jgi:hypothetical protein
VPETANVFDGDIDGPVEQVDIFLASDPSRLETALVQRKDSNADGPTKKA